MKTEITEEEKHCIDVCNGLLRGEMSAVETYGKVIEKFPAESETVELMQIKAEHQRSVDQLKENVRLMGGEPEEGSGAWGTFANAIQRAANLFGENSALCSLKEGEGFGKRDYENALEDGGVMEACKALIRTQLLPRTERHIATLERLASQAG